jgi:putative heme-binding domain-containing protein
MRFLTVLIAFAGLAATQSPRKTNPLGSSPQVAAAGRQLYNTSCTICHGPDGAEGDRGPALVGARRYFRLSENAIFDAIKNGIPGSAMPAAGLPDDDIWRIVAFIRNLRATASDIVVEGSVENGRNIFEGKGGCVQCHMIRGHGGFLGPDLSSVSGERSLPYIQEALTEPRPVRSGYRMVKVTTVDGRKFEGVARNQDSFSLQMLGRDRKLHLFTHDELRDIAYEPESQTKHQYNKILNASEMQDLIAFLSRQARHKVRVQQQGENEVGR